MMAAGAAVRRASFAALLAVLLAAGCTKLVPEPSRGAEAIRAKGHPSTAIREILSRTTRRALRAVGIVPAVPELIRRAEAYRVKGENSAAETELLEAIEQAPANPQSHLVLGSLYSDMGFAVQAETELRTSMALGVKPLQYLPPLGTALLDQEKYSVLLEEVRRLDESKPGPELAAEMALQRGRTYLGLAKPKDARREFGLAMQEKPVAAKLGLAQTAMAENNLADAEKFTEEALATAPSSPDALVAKGDLLRLKSSTDAALAAYDQALKVNPIFVPALVNKASLLLASGKVEEARAQLDIADTIATANVKLVFAQGMLALRDRDFDRCEQALQWIFGIAPKHMPATLLSGAFFLATGQLEQAQSAAIVFLRRYPGHVYGRKILASVFLRKEQPKNAASLLEPLLPLVADDAELLALAAQAQLRMGNLERARTLLEKAVAITPSDPGLRMGLGLNRLAAGDSERAIAELEVAVGLNPNDVMPEVYLVNVLIASNQLDKAAAVVDAFEKKQPGRAETFQLKGAVYLGRLDAANAEKSFARALAIKPSYYPAVAALNQMDLRRNNPASAQQRLEAFLKKDRQNIDAILDLANLHIAAGRIDEATRMLTSALETHPRAVRAFLMLAQLRLQRGQTQEALNVAQKAQKISPQDARVLDALGTAQLAADDSLGAIITFRRMLELVPQSVPALLKLSSAYTAQRELPEAIALIKRALAIEPGNLNGEISLAVAYLNSKRYREAAEIASRMQKERPKQPHGYALEGDVRMAQGHYAEALKSFEIADKVAPSGQLRVRMHQAASLAAGGAAGVEQLRAWLKDQPGDFATRIYLADVYLDAARNKEAIAEYRTLLKLNPRHSRVLNNLAWALHQTGDRSALQYAQDATQIDPASGIAADTLGWILLGQNKPEDGLVSLSRAASLLPDVPEVKYHLAEALFRTGDLNGARRQLRAVLASGAKFKGVEDARELLKKLES